MHFGMERMSGILEMPVGSLSPPVPASAGAGSVVT